ncbi:Riboflavin biosynthesis protein RibD [Rhynchospora pubera]|uniref:Riboflavin biosynthesis protein PYRD, chloroplastic n=1 Tax=Rhynchospora pubera TaxID=906938 RepID=A0AAV8F308_9POAL|nr:Riboflavin biosynthesis protein RibD [Rhynchospora pubera]
MGLSSLLPTPTSIPFTNNSPRGASVAWKNPVRRIYIRCEAIRDDGYYMRRCVELARSALGHTSPNPMVGCVIVRDGEIVGEGFHPKAGQPHAEVFALRDAGDLAEGATAYVSLEPCNHFGRTPPCTEALIKAQVKKVVVGMTDPNPIVYSKGIERLRKEGIEVITGVEENLCRKLNEFFVHRMLTGKPFVTLRYSLSANGHVVNEIGEGAADAGGYYSKLLQEYDGVILSGNLAETSMLPTSKETGVNQPIYIVIAQGRGSLLKLKSVPEDIASKVVVLTDKTMEVDVNYEIETVVMENLSLNSVLDYCSNRGLSGVFVDFRGDDGSIRSLLRNFDEDNLVNKVIMEVLPVWGLGEGHQGLEFGLNNLRLKDLQSRVIDGNVLVEGYFC